MRHHDPERGHELPREGGDREPVPAGVPGALQQGAGVARGGVCQRAGVRLELRELPRAVARDVDDGRDRGRGVRDAAG